MEENDNAIKQDKREDVIIDETRDNANEEIIINENISFKTMPNNNNDIIINEEDIHQFSQIKEQQGETEGKLFLQTKRNKQMEINEFFQQDKHYFIMTDGGKPIYSRYGDELKNSEILATFSAVVTKFTVFNTDESFAEKLK